MADQNDWYYNSYLGEITEMIGPWAALVVHSGIGWHGPFANHDAAVAYYNDNKAANPGWKAPVSDLNAIGIAGNAAGSAGNVIGSAGSAIGGAVQSIVNAPGKAIQDALGPLQADAKIWAMRISEIVLGIVLIAVGLAHLSGGSGAIAQQLKKGIKLIGATGKAAIKS